MDPTYFFLWNAEIASKGRVFYLIFPNLLLGHKRNLFKVLDRSDVLGPHTGLIQLPFVKSRHFVSVFELGLQFRENHLLLSLLIIHGLQFAVPI